MLSINICCTFIACGMVDDLLEYTGDEEDPFAFERYVDIWRDSPRSQAASQGYPQPSGPATPPAGSSFSRLTPQMGINALKMIPEAKIFKGADSRRADDTSLRPISAKQEGGSQSPKGHLLDLHLVRKHRKSPTGPQVGNDAKAGDSPCVSPRQNKEVGSQSPKGILVDLHMARKHRRTPSGGPAGFDLHYSKSGDSPNLSFRAGGSNKQESGSMSPKAHFLDLHLGRKHKRTPSGGQSTLESHLHKPGESPCLSSESSPRDHSPSSEKKLIVFLKSHNPFTALQNLSPSHSHRPRTQHAVTTDGDGSLDSSDPSSPCHSVDVRYPGHTRHSSDSGRRFSALQHQSAPSTPSKVLNRYSADLSGRTIRPRSIVVDGHMMEEGYWDI